MRYIPDLKEYDNIEWSDFDHDGNAAFISVNWDKQ
jgi:hypothetical protein